MTRTSVPFATHLFFEIDEEGGKKGKDRAKKEQTPSYVYNLIGLKMRGNVKWWKPTTFADEG